MIEIIKGRYGYEAEDGTVQIAKSGTKLSLDGKEEQRLVDIGCAVKVEEVKEEKQEPEAVVETVSAEPSMEPAKEPEPAAKPRKRKGRKA